MTTDTQEKAPLSIDDKEAIRATLLKIAENNPYESLTAIAKNLIEAVRVISSS